MSSAIDHVNSFWTTYGVWLSTALIPTIITGLSYSARTAPEASALQKFWNYVKQAMNFLSLLTHKDVPGTFQAPLKATALKKAPEGPVKGPNPAVQQVVCDPPVTDAPKGPTSLTVLALLFFGAVNINCAGLKNDIQPVVNNIIDCAKAEEQQVTSGKSVIQIVLDIAEQIAIAIAAGEDAVKTTVTSLIGSYGEPIVACVFKDEKAALASKPAASEKAALISKMIEHYSWKFKE